MGPAFQAASPRRSADDEIFEGTLSGHSPSSTTVSMGGLSSRPLAFCLRPMGMALGNRGWSEPKLRPTSWGT